MQNRISTIILIVALAFTLPAAAQYGPPVGDNDYDDSNANVFLDDEVTYIDVTMDPQDLLDLIDDPHSDIYKHCDVRIYNSVIDEIVLDVGIRARGNVARDNKKFPLKLSFREFVEGRKFHGLKKFNLASDAGDPTFARSMSLFQTFRDMGVPAPRTHHTYVTINDGELIEGVYINIEQVDDEFVQAWFGDDTGDLYKCRHKAKPANLKYIEPGTPETYRDLGGGETYEEKINDENFIVFADFVDFLEHADDFTFATQIDQWINVDGFLRAMAVDMTGGQWDGYWFGANNYYLYHNPETLKFEYIPWDLDNSFGSDYYLFPVLFGENWATRDFQGWGRGGFGADGKKQPILMRRLLDVPVYKEALLRYNHQAIEGPFSLAIHSPRLDLIQNLLGPLAFMGSFSGQTMDNGYTNEDFHKGFDNPQKYSRFHIPMTWGIRPFIRKRIDYVRNEYPQPIPLPRIFINELVAKNDTIIHDEAGEYDDYVELYNDEEFAVDLTGTYLSDYAGDSRRWPIPDGTVLEPKQFLIIWCDDDTEQGPYHANFKLSGSGEGVWLFGGDVLGHGILNHLIFPELDDDEAFGRYPDGAGNVGLLANASPGEPNADTETFYLIIDGACPGTVSLYTTGATPNELVAFIAADGTGQYTIEDGPVCIGTTLDLNASLFIAGIATADTHGTAVLTGVAPEPTCGQVYIQALDVSTCEITQVEQL